MLKRQILIKLFVFANFFLFAGAGVASQAVNLETVNTQLQNLQTNVNFVWVLLCAALVYFMQAGFMCLESGWCRAKNSINVAVKNMFDFVIAVALFWLIGFPLMFGESQWGLFGWGDFFINTDNPDLVLFFCFQVVFAGTAATIDSGAIAERTKFLTYLTLSAVTSAIIYPIFGHWAWGSLFNSGQAGWLESMGFIDFAGSTVVHSVGGWMALVVAYIVGPRLGKYDENGNAVKIRPHNLTLVYLGGFILTLGWFGFNCGSTVIGDKSIAGIAFNTLMASSFGCIMCSTLSWFFSERRQPEPEMIVSGLLAGLVGITAGCASVGVGGAIAIGLGSGAVCYWAVGFVENTLKIDDVVGAASVHGFCGAFGTIATGFFILPEALGDTPRLTFIGVQCLGVLTCFAWTVIAGGTFAYAMHKIFNLRVSEEEEKLGLNIAEHGATSSLIDLSKSIYLATSHSKYGEEYEVEVEHGTEIGELTNSFNKMLKSVRESLSESERAKLRAFNESKNAKEALKLAKQEKLYAESMRDEADNLREKVTFAQQEKETLVSQTRDQLVDIINQVESNFQQISEATRKVHDQMDNVMGHSKKISSVLDVINELTKTSGFLALNAMIEASRSGEAGRSFAVVAGEMQSMSSGTKVAASDIGETLVEIGTALNDLVEDVSQQGEKLDTNKDMISRLNELVNRLVDRNMTTDDSTIKVA